MALISRISPETDYTLSPSEVRSNRSTFVYSRDVEVHLGEKAPEIEAGLEIERGLAP